MTNKLVTLDWEKVNALLDRAVAEKGADYVYPDWKDGQCVYFEEETGNPSCIVGHVLSYSWVTADDLSDFDNISTARILFSRNNGDGITLRDADGSSGMVMDLLFEVQSCQDSGVSWGESVELARDKVISEFGERCDD